MPTYRKLHTCILESPHVADMPDDFHRLFWTWLPLILSADGTTIYDPRYVRSRMFPLRDDITVQRIAEVLAWFEQRGMIRPYDADCRRYLFVPSFAHDQGDTSREAHSTFPKPPADSATTHVKCMSTSRNAPEAVLKSSCSDSDTDAGAHVDADADADATTKAAAAPLCVPPPERRGLDHETTPEPELLRELHQAFQRGTSQAVTDALPTGAARAALRELMDDHQTAPDIESCARYLKAGWWRDKTLTVPKLAESIGQWIAQGRPLKPSGQARAGPDPGHQSPAIAAFREFQKMQEGTHGISDHADSGHAGFGVSPGQDRSGNAGRVSGSSG